MKEKTGQMGLDPAAIEYTIDESIEPIPEVIDYLVKHAPERSWSPFRVLFTGKYMRWSIKRRDVLDIF